MRNLKFLVGAIGGMLGGILLSNKNLRRRLKDAKDAKEAAAILGKEMQRSGKQVVREAETWFKDPATQEKIRKAKEYLGDKLSDAGEHAKEKAGKAFDQVKRKVVVGGKR